MLTSAEDDGERVNRNGHRNHAQVPRPHKSGPEHAERGITGRRTRQDRLIQRFISLTIPSRGTPIRNQRTGRATHDLTIANAQFLMSTVSQVERK